MKQYTLTIVSNANTEEFITSLSNKFAFSDEYTNKFPFALKDHYHNDFESRLFIEGTGTFVIDGEEITCGPGSYIEIEPNVVHSFKTQSDNLKVVRFFSTEDSWKATFL